MNLMKLVHVSPVVVHHDATVADAVKAMVENTVGAVAVVENERIEGIFSERDLMKKVIYCGLSPEQTQVSTVMTTKVESVHEDMELAEVLRLMLDGHFRHLPIVDRSDRIRGVLSIRDILQYQVEDLEDSINTLTSYYSADGPGG